MSSPSDLPLDQLARRCAEETEKYLHHQPNSTDFCFELMRRALAENHDDAFTYVYHTYHDLVRTMVYRHKHFERTGEDAEFFALEALRRFYQSVRGPKFARFPSLGHLLAYLRACVNAAICQFLRDRMARSSVPLDLAADVDASAQPDDRLNVAELWARICDLLPDERDRLLVRCRFVLGMKPREILAVHPEQWRDEREISVALFRIKTLLRKDDDLRQRNGSDDG